jgi:hypothetical protein
MGFLPCGLRRSYRPHGLPMPTGGWLAVACEDDWCWTFPSRCDRLDGTRCSPPDHLRVTERHNPHEGDHVPRFANGETAIYYEEHGSGFPLLLIAPGAMDSAIDLWSGATINPLDAYSGDFRLIAMDQRNAGRSTGPLEVADPWGAYARDQLALLDHLGIQSFHVMGA